METAVNIALACANLAVALCIIVPAAVALIKTKGKLPELFWAALTSVGDAEQSDMTGAEKLEFVKGELLVFCEENGIPFSEKSLARLIEVIVAAANLVRKFLIKRV